MMSRVFEGKLHISEFIFLVAWSFFVITVILQETIWYVNLDSILVSSIFKILRYIAYILCVLIVLRRIGTSKVIVGSMFLLFCLGLCVIGSSNKTMLLYSLFIIAAYKIDVHLIVRASLFWQASILIITIVLSQIGLIEDFIFGENVRTRHGLGFCWATVAPIMFFYCMLLYIYIRKSKMRWYEFFVLEVINYWLYRLTDTRMAFFLSTLFLVFFFFARFNKHRKVKISKCKWLFCSLPTIVATGAILMHALYDPTNSFHATLNRLISGRLLLGKNAINEYGITLIGQKIQWIGFSNNPIKGDYNYVDCSYLQLLLEYGVILLIVVVAIYTLLIWLAIKQHDNYLLIIVCIILIFAITEPRLMNFAYNPFPLLILSKHKTQSWQILKLKADSSRNLCIKTISG